MIKVIEIGGCRAFGTPEFHTPIQNRPEFFIVPLSPLHGVPLQMPWEAAPFVDSNFQNSLAGTKSGSISGRQTRVQWPYRPAATRAMRNRHVMLYDIKWSFDLRFEISNLDYPGYYVHNASNGIQGHGGLLTTSEVI